MSGPSANPRRDDHAVPRAPRSPSGDYGPSGPTAPIEGRAKVTGSARYAADEPMPGPGLRLRCRVHGVPRAHPRHRHLGRPGHARRAGRDRPPQRAAPQPRGRALLRPRRRAPAAAGRRDPYAGRPVALVVAETLEQARAAAEALPVTYDEQPHDTEFSADHPAARPALTIFGEDANVGDVDAELAASARGGRRAVPHARGALQRHGTALGDRLVGRRAPAGRRLEPGALHRRQRTGHAVLPDASSRCGSAPNTSAAGSGPRGCAARS